MKTFLSIVIVLLSVFQVNARSISVSDFNEVRIWGNLKVILMESEENKVNVEYDMHEVDISVDNGILKVKRDKPLVFDSYDSEPIEVVIEYQRIKGLKASAGARIKTTQPIAGDFLEVEFLSGAQGKIAIEVNDLEMKTASGAQLKISGKTYSQRTKVASGGMLNAKRLLSQRTYIKSITGGQAVVVATETLEATASTGGMIDFEGGPEYISIKDNLGGEVREY
jgi:Protein of unknown function (DUF2807).